MKKGPCTIIQAQKPGRTERTGNKNIKQSNPYSIFPNINHLCIYINYTPPWGFETYFIDCIA